MPALLQNAVNCSTHSPIFGGHHSIVADTSSDTWQAAGCANAPLTPKCLCKPENDPCWPICPPACALQPLAWPTKGAANLTRHAA